MNFRDLPTKALCDTKYPLSPSMVLRKTNFWRYFSGFIFLAFLRWTSFVYISEKTFSASFKKNVFHLKQYGMNQDTRTGVWIQITAPSKPKIKKHESLRLTRNVLSHTTLHVNKSIYYNGKTPLYDLISHRSLFAMIIWGVK